jgi:hypothetical protein
VLEASANLYSDSRVHIHDSAGSRANLALPIRVRVKFQLSAF